MRKRRVFVMLELWTDEPLGTLKDLTWWQVHAEDLTSEFMVLQAQANVSQQIPGEIEKEVQKALKKKLREMK